MVSSASESCRVIFFGVTRVFALIGVGAVSALVVAAVKNGAPFDHYLVILAVIAPSIQAVLLFSANSSGRLSKR